MLMCILKRVVDYLTTVSYSPVTLGCFEGRSGIPLVLNYSCLVKVHY